MIRFNVGGEYLDTPEGLQIQLQKINPLFAFASLKCERSTSFDIPATPNNDRIFKLAKWIQSPGIGMRRRFNAQMQNGIVVKNGYLYVTEYDGGKYKCVFVTGELLGLQAIRNAGALKDFLQYDIAFNWDAGNVKRANDDDLYQVDLVNYHVANGAVVSPSVSVYQTINDAIEQLGVNIDWNGTDGADKLRIFNPNMLELNETTIHLKNDPEASQDDINLASFLGITQYNSSAMYMYYPCRAELDDGRYFWAADNEGLSHFNITKLPYDAVIEFPVDLPYNYFLASTFTAWTYDSIRRYYYEPIYPATFLGGWSFDWMGRTSGAPLAGRKIAIPANTPFCLVTPDILVYEEASSGATADRIGLDSSLLPAYDFAVKITIDHEFVQGDTIPWNAILPNVTLVELLQAIAATTGTVLNFENNTLKFEPLQISAWDTIDLHNVISRKNLRRTFMDYAERNRVQYDSGTSVLAGDKLEIYYNIDNDNLEASKDLQTLKVSEGGSVLSVYTSGDEEITYDEIIIRDTEDDKPTLAKIGLSTYMLRTSLMRNVTMQALCDASTSVTINARLSLLEYEQLQPRTRIYYDGVLYVWTEARWSDGVAKIQLAKI